VAASTTVKMVSPVVVSNCVRTTLALALRQPSGREQLRKNYAGVGFAYDEQRDAFIPPKPFPSWTMSEDTCLWSAPTPMPTEGGPFTWNEETLSWDETVVA